jgi:hypothetical protein
MRRDPSKTKTMIKTKPETETGTGTETETEKTDVINHRTTRIRTTAAPHRPEGPSPCPGPSWHTVIHDMTIVSAQSAVYLSAVKMTKEIACSGEGMRLSSWTDS